MIFTKHIGIPGILISLLSINTCEMFEIRCFFTTCKVNIYQEDGVYEIKNTKFLVNLLNFNTEVYITLYLFKRYNTTTHTHTFFFLSLTKITLGPEVFYVCVLKNLFQINFM